MKITFFEVQEWERDQLLKAFPDAQLVEDKLTPDNASNFTNTEVASSFIYSNFGKEVLEKMPSLKYVTTRSTGFDHIDMQTAREKGVTVSNVPEYGSKTVAEHTFALILTLSRRIYESINQAKRFDFFDHRNIQGVDLDGKTLGIIGLGKIGMNVLKIAQGFGMKTIIHTRSRDEELAKNNNFTYAELPELLSSSDFVTLHLPYSEATRHTINKNNVVMMKKGSYLINTARGGLVETEALVIGLEKEILAGVGIDVLEEEKELCEEAEIMTMEYRQNVDFKTLVLDHILMNHPRVVITPHNAFNSIEALNRITETTIQNIQAFLNGSVQNEVRV